MNGSRRRKNKRLKQEPPKEARSQPAQEAPSVASKPTRVLYTKGDLCEMLGVSRATLDRWSAAKLVPGRIKIKGTVRFLADVIDKWVSERMLQQYADHAAREVS